MEEGVRTFFIKILEPGNYRSKTIEQINGKQTVLWLPFC